MRKWGWAFQLNLNELTSMILPLFHVRCLVDQCNNSFQQSSARTLKRKAVVQKVWSKLNNTVESVKCHTVLCSPTKGLEIN